MTDQTRTIKKREARLLSAVDDAVCQYQYETIEARGFIEFIRKFEHHSGGLGESLTEENEPAFLAVYGLATGWAACFG